MGRKTKAELFKGLSGEEEELRRQRVAELKEYQYKKVRQRLAAGRLGNRTDRPAYELDPEDKDRLKQWLLDGVTLQECADIFMLTKQALSLQAKSLGLRFDRREDAWADGGVVEKPKRPHRPRAQWIDVATTFATYREAAEAVGVSPSELKQARTRVLKEGGSAMVGGFWFDFPQHCNPDNPIVRRQRYSSIKEAAETFGFGRVKLGTARLKAIQEGLEGFEFGGVEFRV